MNQIPNIEEEIRHFCNAFAMTMPPSNEMMQATRNLRKQLPSFIHQQLQKARDEERERLEAIFKEHVPPHAMDLEDSVWLKRLLNKAFNHNKNV